MRNQPHSRPFLRAVQDANDFNVGFTNSINNQERKARNDQFARISHPSGSPTVGKGLQGFRTVEN